MVGWVAEKDVLNAWSRKKLAGLKDLWKSLKQKNGEISLKYFL